MYVDNKLLERMIRLVADMQAGKKIRKSRVAAIGRQLEQAKYIPDDGKQGGRFFSVIRWQKDDIKEALRQAGYKTSARNVRLVLESRTGRTLEDQSTADGWDILNVCLTDLDGLEKRGAA